MRAKNPEAAIEEAGDQAVESRRERSAASLEKAKAKVMATALRMLVARARSETQLREKLLAKAWLEHELIDECIARLQELGYVNDRNFAYQYALSRVNTKSIGRARLARELAEKKVSRELIEEALDLVFEEIAEDELINKALAKYVRLHGQPRDAKTGRKCFAHLMRLGFGYELINRKLRSLRLATTDYDTEF